MSLQAANDFFKILEYACVDGTEELQEDLFSDNIKYQPKQNRSNARREERNNDAEES